MKTEPCSKTEEETHVKAANSSWRTRIETQILNVARRRSRIGDLGENNFDSVRKEVLCHNSKRQGGGQCTLVLAKLLFKKKSSDKAIAQKRKTFMLREEKSVQREGILRGKEL